MEVPHTWISCVIYTKRFAIFSVNITAAHKVCGRHTQSFIWSPECQIKTSDIRHACQYSCLDKYRNVTKQCLLTEVQPRIHYYDLVKLIYASRWMLSHTEMTLGWEWNKAILYLKNYVYGFRSFVTVYVWIISKIYCQPCFSCWSIWIVQTELLIA